MRDENSGRAMDRFLGVEMYESPPMKDHLSGLAVEYSIALVYTSEAGRREATIRFKLGDDKSGDTNDKSTGQVSLDFDMRPQFQFGCR